MKTKYGKVLIVSVAIIALAACKPQAPSSASPELEKPEASQTTAQEPTEEPPMPTITPTQGPSSAYFDHVELVETSTLAFEPGDDEYFPRSAALYDMNGDGYPEAIVTFATYPENIPHPIFIFDGQGPISNIAPELFPEGVPVIAHSNQIFFIDINNDGLEDMLISDAGLDRPPWVTEDSKIGIGINLGNGLWKNVSETVPEDAKGIRNYALAAGDIYNDGIVRIVYQTSRSLLFWNGTEFELQRNWVTQQFWNWDNVFHATSFMQVLDLDNDGWQDLYISGDWTTPNHRVIFGSENFPSKNSIVVLPDGPYGHTPWKTFEEEGVARGADVNKVVFEDFDGDGDLDIVALMEDVHNTTNSVDYKNFWFQVIRNDGERQFVDLTDLGQDLGPRYYITFFSIDFDLDGDLDLLGHYWGKTWGDNACGQRWGTTLFINQGDFVFQKVEFDEVFPEPDLTNYANLPSDMGSCTTHGLGIFFPTSITQDQMEGLFVVPIEKYGNSDQRHLRILRILATGAFQMP